MAERLVFTLEVWVAAIAGLPVPEGKGELLPRFDRAGRSFTRLATRAARRRWDHAFVDALCEPPQSFTYGGVVSHILTFGAVRCAALAGVLTELGATVGPGDPILWEAELCAALTEANGATGKDGDAALVRANRAQGVGLVR